MKRHHFSFWVVATITAFSPATAWSEDAPATPTFQSPPSYPAACLPASDESPPDQSVVVVFEVTEAGDTANARIRESSNACFDEVAVAAVRAWRYEPRRVDKRAVAQEDLEATFTFVFDGETEIEEFDARPILRTPPEYPEKCMYAADSRETVLVQFDVNELGRTMNVEVVETTNRCLSRAAKRSAEKWRYVPRIASGKPVVRKNVQTMIAFELSNGGEPSHEIRRKVKRRLENVRKTLSKTGDTDAALSELALIETEYGDTFSRAEQAMFYYLRGIARVAAKDYAGALDDLRFVKRNGLTGNSHDTIEKLIFQLEAMVGQADSPAPADGDESETGPDN